MSASARNTHWLLFEVIEGRHHVVGCNCGFEADLDEDCGWGDSVVAHLMQTAREQAIREGGEIHRGVLSQARRTLDRIQALVDKPEFSYDLGGVVEVDALAAALRGDA